MGEIGGRLWWSDLVQTRHARDNNGWAAVRVVNFIFSGQRFGGAVAAVTSGVGRVIGVGVGNSGARHLFEVDWDGAVKDFVVAVGLLHRVGEQAGGRSV